MRGAWLAGRRIPTAAALVFLLCLTGCGTRYYPVRGTVTLDDGTPLTKGLVIFESENPEGGPAFMARGEIKPDGSYQLSTHKKGDGVPPGRYRVLINPIDLSDIPDEKKKLPFDIKYLNLNTSGLEFEVKAEPNEIPIKLNRPAKNR